MRADDADVREVDVDVLIVGAGLSGVGAAARLRMENPDHTFVVLEARSAIGGTWDQFRYPGVRSDSDVSTYGYPFRPWIRSGAFAPGAEIRDYIEATAREYGVQEHLQLRTQVVSASWSTPDGRWTVRARTAGADRRFTCTFLWVCAGYFDYLAGYQPVFPGVEDFGGRLVHPQFWPADLSCAGRRVVVIGSGATAVTLAPALARQGAAVTLVQRSPGYVVTPPSHDSLVRWLTDRLPPATAHRLVRARALLTGQLVWELCRRLPRASSWALRRGVAARVGPAATAEHFTPAYRPWDERLCVAPDGDLLTAIAAGDVAMVTDTVERLVPEGLELGSGRRLPADVVVSATGLSLRPVGGIALDVDGRPVDPAATVVYRGVMLTGVPNFGYSVGYVNASWTLRADLSARFVCRFLRHLRRHDLTSGTPDRYRGRATRPLLGLNAGYVRRARSLLPRLGLRAPFTLPQNYPLEAVTLPVASLRRGLTFVGRRRRAHDPVADPFRLAST